VAEPLDPVLEPALRAALRSAADEIPLRIRADDVRAAVAGRARARRRLAQAAIAASFVVLAVGGLALASAYWSSGRVASEPPPAGAVEQLPEYDRLLEITIGGRELARAEGLPGGGTTVMPVASVEATRPAELVLACRGGAVRLPDFPAMTPDGRINEDLPLDVACTEGTYRIWLPGSTAVDVAAGGLVVDPEPGAAWRAVVVGLPAATATTAGTAAVTGLPSFEDLALGGAPGAPEIARGSGTAGEAPLASRIAGLDGPLAIEVNLACVGGPLAIVWAGGPGWQTELGGSEVPCLGEPLSTLWTRYGGMVPASELHVYASPETRWMALVVDATGPGTPMPAP
jgi:hypothetical protein